jgi:hypothetical protein
MRAFLAGVICTMVRRRSPASACLSMKPARSRSARTPPDVLDGTVEPGRVFDRTVGLEEVPDGS